MFALVLWMLFLAAEPAGAQTSTEQPAFIALPDGSGGIGFDDLRFSAALGKVLVPTGRTGNLDLIDPADGRVLALSGFSTRSKFGGGHGEGITSVDEGTGFLFVTDRSSLELDVVEPASQAVVTRARLAASPDYVRFVDPSREVWVTEPDKDRIEVFRFASGPSPRTTHEAFIAVDGGPESLVIDPVRGRAYTHLWSGKSVAIDLRTRSIVARWPNGCAGSRGIALDEERGLLFVGCAEGKATVLDVATGTIRSSLEVGSGVDIIAYDLRLGHVYVPSAHSARLWILGVSARGELSLLGTFPTAPGSHCVTVDSGGTAYLCDPEHGRLLVIRDRFPASPH